MPIIDKIRLKNAMIRCKEFLGSLYKSNSLTAKKILNRGNDFEIRTLIHVLHCLAVGEIKIRREDAEKLNFSRKVKYLHKTFATKSKVTSMLKSPRSEQLDAAEKLSSCYPHLFFL